MVTCLYSYVSLKRGFQDLVLLLLKEDGLLLS